MHGSRPVSYLDWRLWEELTKQLRFWALGWLDVLNLTNQSDNHYEAAGVPKLTTLKQAPSGEVLRAGCLRAH